MTCPKCKERGWLLYQKDEPSPPYKNEHNIDGGIYRMYDKAGEIVYVGKSGSLRDRIRNHIHHRTHIAYFMDEVVKIEWHEEPDPVFETLLESIFIAYHLPKHNDEIKDAQRKFGDDYGNNG